MKLSQQELEASAKKVMDTVCEMLEEEELNYERIDESWLIHLGMKGTDFPIDIYFKINVERQVVTVFTNTSVTIPESGLADVSAAITMLNEYILEGNFDLDFSEGRIQFRYSAYYGGSIISKECYSHMMYLAISYIDQSISDMFAIGKKLLPLEQFMQKFE